MIATTDFVPYRCANPACPSRRAGRGQIVMRGLSTVGWCGEGRCHQCRCTTQVQVTEQGVMYLIDANTRFG